MFFAFFSKTFLDEPLDSESSMALSKAESLLTQLNAATASCAGAGMTRAKADKGRRGTPLFHHNTARALQERRG